MKIISYNVNGIRAAAKKGFFKWLEATNADMICLQEVKALKEQIPEKFQNKVLLHLKNRSWMGKIASKLKKL